MSGFAVIKAERPVCFGSSAKFSNSPDCDICKSYSSCAHSIEIDALLEDIEDRPESNEQAVLPLSTKPSSVTTAVIRPKAVFHAAHLKSVVVAASPYSFPVTARGKYDAYSNIDLICALKGLIAKAFYGAAPSGYAAVREELCAMHLEINTRQLIAPRFRPMPKLAQKPQPGDETFMALDRQVIDIHWRAFSKSKPYALIQNYEGIFEAPDFSFALAERFAQERWKPGAKAVHLYLTEDMQWEHAVLQVKSIRDKWRCIEFGDVTDGTNVKQRGAPHIEAALRASMNNSPHLVKHIPGLVRVWMARRIVGDHPARIAQLVSLMTGEKPRDVRAVRRSIETLDAHLSKV